MMLKLVIKSTKNFGFILYVVIFIVAFVSILALQFMQVAKNQQSVAFRFEQNEALRQLAEGAIEEAFMRFFNETANPKSAAGTWLLSRSNNSFRISLPVSTAKAPSLIRSDLTPIINAEVRIVDFRNQDSKGNSYLWSDEARDGNGTLEFTVTSELVRRSMFDQKRVASCKIVRHHDYLVVSMITPRNNTSQRDRYSHCFPLDYVLMVRDGLNEFRSLNGFSIHQDKNKAKLTIVQDDLPAERRGKIYFGGTDPTRAASGGHNETPKGNYIFLNLSEKFKNQIPQLVATQVIEQSDVCMLLPHLLSEMEAKAKAQDSRIQSISFSGIKGKFIISTEPTIRENYSGDEKAFEKYTLNALSEALVGAEQNYFYSFDLISERPENALDEAFVSSICEGAIRKRFFYYVHFVLDLTGATYTGTARARGRTQSFSGTVSADEAAEAQKWEHRIPCVPMPPGNLSPQQIAFYQALPVINAKLMNTSASKLQVISRFEDSYRFGGNGGDLVATPPAASECFPKPRFFNSKGMIITEDLTGESGFRPYNHFNLWYRKKVSPVNLKNIGLFDFERGVINLRGITHISGNLQIEPVNGRNWEICGQGVIIADNIKLATGIRKQKAEDLCVFFTRKGSIFIDTTEPIEAVLIATGDHKRGFIRPSQPMNLKGALIVDLLDTPGWAPGNHRIVYDPLLKSPSDAHYQINISRWVTFQRITEL